MTMEKTAFVQKLMHQQYVRKLDKKKQFKEIDEYISDSRQSKYKHRVMHSKRK